MDLKIIKRGIRKDNMCQRNNDIPIPPKHTLDSLGKGFVQLSKNLIKVLLPKAKAKVKAGSLELAELSEKEKKEILQ